MFDFLGMAYKDSDYTAVIAVVRWPKCIILVLKCTLLVKCFCLPSTIIAQTSASTFVGSTALRKGPWRFWLHCHDCCHAL